VEANSEVTVKDRTPVEGTQTIDLAKASSRRFESELARKKLKEAVSMTSCRRCLAFKTT